MSILFNSRLEYLCSRHFPVLMVDILLTALGYFGTGSIQLVVGHLFGIQQTSAGRIVKRVKIVLADFIKMPSSVDEVNGATSEYNIKVLLTV